MTKKFFNRRSTIQAKASSEQARNYDSAFSILQAYASEFDPENPKTDPEIAEILQSLTVPDITFMAKTGGLTDSAREGFAPPKIPNVARPGVGLPSSRVPGAMQWATNVYAFSQSLPDMYKTVRDRAKGVRDQFNRVRDFGKEVIDEVTKSGNSGGSKLGIRITNSSIGAGADARYMKVTPGDLDYKSGPLIDFISPNYLQPTELTYQPVLDSTTFYAAGSGGHFETPLLLQVVNWIPSFRDEAFLNQKGDYTPDPRDYIAYVANRIFFSLNDIELQQTVNFRLPPTWSERNMYSYLVTVLDALQILVDVNVVRIAYLENKECNVGINQLAALLANEEIARLDTLEILIQTCFLPDQLARYFWTISQFMSYEDVSGATMCKFIGTHAVCEDPNVRVGNIDYLLEKMRSPEFRSVNNLLNQCNDKGGMLKSWAQMQTVAVGFGKPKYSPQYSWLWANNSVCQHDFNQKSGLWMPLCNDVQHSVYAQTRIDEIDLMYYLSASIPFMDPKTGELSKHFNSIMVPHPVACKASGESSSSILFSGHNGLEIIEFAHKSQPMTGNIHMSGFNDGVLPTPTALPGWKRLDYYSIQHRDQYMREFLNSILDLKPTSGGGDVAAPEKEKPNGGRNNNNRRRNTNNTSNNSGGNNQRRQESTQPPNPKDLREGNESDENNTP
jgi:hypothetical protein